MLNDQSTHDLLAKLLCLQGVTTVILLAILLALL